MRLKLGVGILLLIFLVAFSCTSKKPSEFDEVTVFRGKVLESNGKPAQNAVVELVFPIGQNCVCKPGNIIECATLSDIFTYQPTNAKGEYQVDLAWRSMGFLFDESSPCQLKYHVGVATLQVIGGDTSYYFVVEDSVAFSSQDRSVAQVNNFQLP